MKEIRMRDKLQKVWQLFLLLFDSVEASVKPQSAKRCGENWERPYPQGPTRKDLPQRPLAHFGSFRLCRVPRVARIAIFFVLMLAIPTTNRTQNQQQTRQTGSEPVPEPAVPAILAALDKYEVVAMPQGHGVQDLNDFILSLIRNPAPQEFDREIVNGAEDPLFAVPNKSPDPKEIKANVQSCLDRKSRGKTPQ
jgi:hypothetical protein